MSKTDALMQATTEEQKKKNAPSPQKVEEPRPRAHDKNAEYLKRVMDDDKVEEMRRKHLSKMQALSPQSRKESTVSAYAQEIIK